MSQLKLKPLSQILRLFYIKETNRIVTLQHRNLCVGAFFVIFENFFLVLCALLRHDDSSLRSLDPNLYFAIHQAKSAFDFNQDQLKACVTVIMGLNILIIGLVCILIVFQAQKHSKKQSLEYQEQALKEKGKNIPKQMDLQGIIVLALSLVTSCYRQVVFPVGVFVSFLAIADPRGIITLLLTFSLGIAVTDSDFSYIHFAKDILSKPYHSSRFVVLVFEGFTYLSIANVSDTVFMVIALVFFIFKLISETAITPYWNNQTQSLNFCVLLISIITTSIFVLGFHSFNSDQLSVSILLLVIDLPFSVVLTWSFMRFQQRTMNIELQNLVKNQDSPSEYAQIASNCELERLDRILRNNAIFQPGDSLRQQENHAIFLYSALSLDWLDSNNQNHKIDVFDMHQAKHELINSIAKKFESSTKGKDEIAHMHLYLSFLLCIQGNYRLFWLNSQKFKRNQGIPLKNQQLINSICRHFKTYKRELQEKILRIAVQEKDNSQLKTDSSALLRSLNPFYEGFLNVLEFEEHIDLSYSLITQATKLKLDLLELMKSRFINSKLLAAQIDELEEKLAFIRQHIRRAYLINSRSAKVADLQVIFMKSLAFTADEKVLKRTRNNLSGNNAKFDEELSQYNGDLKMFSRNQCVLFAQLEDSFELKTLQVSGNFRRLFRCDPRDILNQQTTRLMPRVFQNVHHTYVKRYLTQTEGQLAIEKDIHALDKQDIPGSSEDALLRMKDKLIFAALNNDKSGIIITPIEVEVKLNTLTKTQQLGFSARLRVINNGQDYILFSANALQTRGVTENLLNLLGNVSREFCSSFEKFNVKLLFPFLSSVQDCNLTEKDTIQRWKNCHKSKFQAVYTSYIVLFKNTAYIPQKDTRFNSTNYIQQAKVTSNPESQPINQTSPRSAAQKQFSNYDIMELSSPLATIQENFQRAQTYQSTQHENVQKNEQYQEDSYNSFRSRDSISCGVFQVDMQLIDINYTGLEDLFAIQISRIRQLKQGESQLEASNQIQQYFSIYTQFYPQQQLQLFIRNSNSPLGGFYDKRNSLMNQNTSPNSGSFIGSPQSLSQIQDKQHLQIVASNNDSSRDQQNALQLSASSPIETKPKEEQYYQIFNYNKAVLAQQIPKRDRNIPADNLILLSQASKRSNSSLIKHNDSVLAMSSSKPLMLASFNMNYNDDTQEMLQQFTSSPISTQRIRLNNHTISEEPEEQFQQQIVYSDPKGGHAPELKRGKYVPNSYGEIKLKLDSKYKNKTSFKNYKSQYQINSGLIDQSNDENKDILGQESDQDEDDDDEEEEGATQKKQQNEKDLLAEIESHRSKASSTASLSQLKNYVKLLSGKEKSQAILVINYIGYLCYLVMAGLTVLTYIEVDSKLSSSFYDNSYSIWPMKYSWIMLNIFTNQNVQILVNQGDLNTADSLPTAASKLAYVTQTQSEAPGILNTWKMLVADSYRVGTKRGVFQYFLNHNNVFWFQQLYNSTLIKGASSVQSGFPVFQKNETVLSSGAYMMPMLARYITGVVELSEYYVITNSMNIVASLKLILNDIQSQYDYSNSNIQTNLINSMVIVVVMSFICLILLIPLDIFIQFRRDGIIELFSSFSINEIESMVQNIHASLLGSRNVMKTIKNLPQVTKKIADPKRQPLGNTSPLPKLNLRLIVIAVIGYALILTGPILNQVFTQTYIEQTKYLYRNKGKIYEIKAHSSNIMQINYQCLILKIRPASKPVPLSLMMTKAISKNGLIQYYTDFLAAIIQDQENLINVHEDFRNFFFAAIEHDICKAFTDYPEYTTSKMKTFLPSCKTLKQGILQQGFSISMRTFYAIFPTFNSFYTTPSANIPTFLNQINSSFDLKEFTDFNQFLEEVIESLGNFIVIQYQNQFDFIRNLQLGIMIYQLTILSLVFLAGWSRFASHLNSQFARTQQQLRVLNINALVENNYVIAYFKKHNRT